MGKENDIISFYEDVKNLHRMIINFSGEVYSSDDYELLGIIEDSLDLMVSQIEEIKTKFETNFSRILEVD